METSFNSTVGQGDVQGIFAFGKKNVKISLI